METQGAGLWDGRLSVTLPQPMRPQEQPEPGAVPSQPHGSLCPVLC